MQIIGYCGSGACSLIDPVVFSAVKDLLKVVEPHLDLTDYVEALKTPLSFGYLVVALACKRYSRKHLNLQEYANWRDTIHLYGGCGHK